MIPKTQEATRKLVIGRRQPCDTCGRTIRVLYLVARACYWLADDFDPDFDEPIVTHDCTEGDPR